ncbi:MAG: hypothetical protein DWQ36_24275 [Acidobacteria bacterium]|nr:MAG: hypothetical protein DWQ30_07470 [Acidobacteriota bacterium]REK00266.1 MAG: hypothetical protein DWQ36_24275 [Acidobacteriota bacterium]
MHADDESARAPSPQSLEAPGASSEGSTPATGRAEPGDVASFAELLEPFGIQAPAHEVIRREQMPAAAARLLAHRRHMTVTLERRLESALRLAVVESRHREPHYSRRIRLHAARTDELALFGVMRFDFRACSSETRAEILAGGTPLGRILIASGALRTVHLHRLIRLPSGSALRQWYGANDPEATWRVPGDLDARPLWGRLASIHCDDRPAVDLVEILAPHLAQAT